MVVRIVIAGESQCETFAEVCLVADYLAKNLPNFCYERIEAPVCEWPTWLCKTNQKNKWHHIGSPIVWKEMLMKGSKPSYIGGAPEFLDYCHSYYKFDYFLKSEKFEGLVQNFAQYKRKLKQESQIITRQEGTHDRVEQASKINFVVCISGAGNPLTMYILSGLLNMTTGEKNISKVYIYDSECSNVFMEHVERECSYIGTTHPGKVVTYVDKIGSALTHTDLLIILDHVPFHNDVSIGDWLYANRNIMENLALIINASASRKMFILFPNLGPACYNATVLVDLVNINKNNIVVATSDIGLEISSIAAEIAQVSLRNMFCPPVWGFVGINHLVDIRTTIHRYNTFEPYNRHTKVRNSTLNIGSVTPEMRTMEYLMYFDESLWIKVADMKKVIPEGKPRLNKAVAALNVVKLWLFEKSPNDVINLGIRCDGSFGLTFTGVFSQPSRFVNGQWTTARDFMLPKDPQMNLIYLEKIAKMAMKMFKAELPNIVSLYPCICTPRNYKKKRFGENKRKLFI